MQKEIGGRLIAMLPRLRRMARGLCGNREMADDLVQIACERALARAESWQSGSNFEGWMFTILRNAWYDRLRRRRSEGIVEDIEDHAEISTSPTAAVEARLTLGAVEQVIARLPADQREVLILVCVEEFSYKEVSDMLGIPIGTVMSRLSRARTRITETLGITAAAER